MVPPIPRTHFPYSLRSRRMRSGRRPFGKPESERNVPAAFFSLLVGGLFAVALAEPNWLSIKGGKCNGHHLGLYKIFGVGGHSEKELEESYCMNKNVILKLKLIASLCLLGVVVSLFQFTLDTWGVTRKGFSCIRRNAIGDILSVFIAISLMGLCYWITLDIENSESTPKKRVKAKLDIAFYLTVGSGAAAVIATTLNLLQCTCDRRNRNDEDDMSMELMYHELLATDTDLPPIPPPLPPPTYQP